jgi:hypothetical protein
MPNLTVNAYKLWTTIYSDEENVSKQPQSDENLFVERGSEQPNGGPLEFAGHKGGRWKEL